MFTRGYHRQRKIANINYREATFGTGAGGTKHSPYKSYFNNFANHDISSFYKMIIVRNPWDLLVSDFWAWGYPPSQSALIEKSKRNSVKYLSEFLGGVYYRSFRKFLIKMSGAKRGTMGDMISGCENDVKIIKYENYDSEVSDVFNDLGMSSPYKRMNEKELAEDYDLRYGGVRRRPIDYREMYTDATKDLVYKLCKKDIKKFNYEF